MVILLLLEDVLGLPFRVSRELISRHLEQGDDVHVVVCNGSLRSCPANNRRDWQVCMMCRSKRERNFKTGLLQHAKQHTVDLSYYEDRIRLPVFRSIEEVKQFTWKGINHGMEAASTVISALRDAKPDMHVHQQMVQNCVFTSIALYQEMLSLIAQVRPDHMYVLNGRRASQMPGIRAAMERDISFDAYEVGHNTERGFVIIENTYFHDLENIQAEIEEAWDNAPDRDKAIQTGRTFYQERRYGTGKEFIEAQFTDNQVKDLLPQGLDRDAWNVAIFNSSEDEFAAVEGYQNPVYRDQIAALPAILGDPNLNPAIMFYLRVHPNLRGVDNFQIRAIEELDFPNLRVISPDSDVDTYALMEACTTSLSFGSTMGIESAFFGKPSIVVGRTAYEATGACYLPRTHEDVIDLLNTRNLQPLEPTGALKYGYYMAARDHEFRHVPNGPGETNAIPGPARPLQYIHQLRKQGIAEFTQNIAQRAARKIRQQVAL